MSLKSIIILGVTITTNPKKEILEYVRKYLDEKEKGKRKKEKLQIKPLIIVTPNPEQVVLAKRDKQFANIHNQADVAIPDGVGISLAAKFLNAKCHMPNAKWKLHRIPGIEFMEDLAEMAQKEGYGVGLIGGRGGVAVEALECLKKKFPGLHGWAEDGLEVEVTENGGRIMYYGSTNKPLLRSIHHNTSPIIHLSDNTEDYFQKIAHRIKESDTQIVFVGLGAPKQEYFIDALAHHASMYQRIKVSTQEKHISDALTLDTLTHQAPLVLMSVGGSFDILAGRVARAPFIMRHIGLEWLWRLIREPWRWRRQSNLFRFLYLIIRDKLASR